MIRFISSVFQNGPAPDTGKSAPKQTRGLFSDDEDAQVRLSVLENIITMTYSICLIFIYVFIFHRCFQLSLRVNLNLNLQVKANPARLLSPYLMTRKKR